MVDQEQQNHFIRVMGALAHDEAWSEDSRESLAAIRIEILEMLAVNDPVFGDDAKMIVESIRSGQPFCKTTLGFLMGTCAGRKLEQDMAEEIINKEVRRTEGHAITVNEQRTVRKSRVKRAHELLAEYGPAGVKKRGKRAICAEIGRKMQDQYGTLDEDGKRQPLSWETVRDYLKERIPGEA